MEVPAERSDKRRAKGPVVFLKIKGYRRRARLVDGGQPAASLEFAGKAPG